jgi:hypothetical protein
LADWLAVFGFHLDHIPRLQSILQRPRTTLLDSKIYDPGVTVSWFRDLLPGVALPQVAPLTQLLEISGSQRLSSLLAVNTGRFLYAKIGRQDNLAYPELLPGSIVRANAQAIERFLPRPGGTSKSFFLVEHSRGFCCCRLYMAAKNRVTLTATQLPFANVELQLGPELRVLGVLDLEFRPLARHGRTTMPACAPPEVAPELARLWTPALLDDDPERARAVLRKARFRGGLSFRHASELSRAVAADLRDERYFTSPGSLSDYEASDAPPRHIHKLFSLSILYSIAFAELLHSFELPLNEGGMDSIPDEWMPRRVLEPSRGLTATTGERAPRSTFIAAVHERVGDFPFFLLNSLAALGGLPEISLRDVFWVGGQPRVLHPALAGGLFAIVDHRKRIPRAFRRKSAWEQPLYLLVKRDGSYVLASGSLEDDSIIVHPYTESFVPSERLRNRVDAEVIGQIVAIVRSLPSPP